MNRLSNIYGKSIYSDSNYLGKAKDVLIEPETGQIKYLLKGKPSTLLGKEKNEARKYIKENFIPFEKVKAIKDIVVVEGLR